MPTFNQILKNKRITKKHKIFKPAISGSPQKKGYCLKIIIRSPKKPNSARRKAARVYLSDNQYRIFVLIPGEGHNLQKYSVVLVRGGRRRDVPGIRYLPIRGKFDLPPLLHTSGRSRWGIKKLWQDKKKLRYLKKKDEEKPKLESEENVVNKEN